MRKKGAGTGKNSPRRRCCGCGASFGKYSLLRVALTGTKAVFDEKGAVQGRGAYVCPKPECIEKARKRKGFERSLKAAVDGGVYDAAKAFAESEADKE